MTTLLSATMKDKAEVLTKWKARVGETAAARISHEATTKGKSFHKIAEDYLHNRLDPSLLLSSERHRFNCALSSLNRIDNVRHVEQGLYSRKLRIAGTVDAIADFDCIPSVIDHKTSRSLKKEAWIENYFLQKTGYALMYEELTGVKIKQIVTIISVESADFCQVFVKNPDDYKQKLFSLILEYYAQ